MWVGGTESGAFFSLLDEFVPGMSLLAMALNRSRCIVSCRKIVFDLIAHLSGFGLVILETERYVQETFVRMRYLIISDFGTVV